MKICQGFTRTDESLKLHRKRQRWCDFHVVVVSYIKLDIYGYFFCSPMLQNRHHNPGSEMFCSPVYSSWRGNLSTASCRVLEVEQKFNFWFVPSARK